MPMFDLMKALRSLRPRRLPMPTGIYLNVHAWQLLRCQWDAKFPKEIK